MFPSNPRFVLALLAVSSFGNFLLSVDGKCKIKPVDGHVNWPSKKKKIKRNAFKNCKELVTICIPPEVESIHNTAFVKSGLDLTKLYEVPCDADPTLFFFKGPLKIERSAEGEPAAVLAAPPTDYFLQFTIKLKSISDGWTSIITMTDDGYAYPDYLYGQWVPGVYVNYNTTEIVAYYGDDENGSRVFYSQPLELNKKSTVLIKVYETTATMSVNGVVESTRTVGPRSQLNDVELYLGDPWTVPADAIVSDISFGLVDTPATSPTSPLDTPATSPTSPPTELVDIPNTADALGFTTLVTVLMAAGLVEPLSNPPNVGPFTVFAPTNQAFDLLGDTMLSCLLSPENLEVLQNILSYHVANELLLAEDLSDSQVFLMLNGERIVIYIGVDGTVTINDNSVIETADVMATNGVIHAIDQVLVPPGLNIAEFLETCASQVSTNAPTNAPTDTPMNALSNAPTSDQYFEWISQTSAADNYWWGVTYGNGIFVAVSATGTADNRVMTSPDGIEWTSQISAANINWSSVTYGKGIFVAVSYFGSDTDDDDEYGPPICENRVMTSPDGIVWTSQTSATNNDWYGVTYGKGIFVAVGSSQILETDSVMTSPDGIEWTSQASAADNYWSSVTYGKGIFVAVCPWGRENGVMKGVMTSPDGIKWTSQTSVGDYWVSVTYGDGIFVAVSATGTGTGVMTSPDGIKWTSQTSATKNWGSVTYGNGIFVAVSTTGVMTSPDGIAWTSRASATNNYWNGVTYGDGIFVAVSSTGIGNRVMTWAP